MRKIILSYLTSLLLVWAFCFPSLASTANYNKNYNNPSTEESYSINIKMVGDDLIHKAVYEQCKQPDGTYNFDKLFANVKTEIENADIAIINQETILVHDRNKISSYPAFGTPEEIGHAIVNSGFDVVAHATNHTMDKGISGIYNTLSFWKNNYPNITILGIHENDKDSDIRYLTKNNIKVGFVNYTYGLNGLESKRNGNEYIVDLLSDSDIDGTLAEARDNCDLLISILHIGNEYVYEPTKYQKEQIEKFIDLGSDIVLCSHPHVIQPYEMITTKNGNQGLVYYSLGNFVSSQNEVPRVLGGMADINVKKTIKNRKSIIEILDYDLIPLITHQELGNYTTYLLNNYSEELSNRHRLKNKGFSKETVINLYNSIIKK